MSTVVDYPLWCLVLSETLAVCVTVQLCSDLHYHDTNSLETTARDKNCPDASRYDSLTDMTGSRQQGDPVVLLVTDGTTDQITPTCLSIHLSMCLFIYPSSHPANHHPSYCIFIRVSTILLSSTLPPCSAHILISSPLSSGFVSCSEFSNFQITTAIKTFNAHEQVGQYATLYHRSLLTSCPVLYFPLLLSTSFLEHSSQCRAEIESKNINKMGTTFNLINTHVKGIDLPSCRNSSGICTLIKVKSSQAVALDANLSWK